MLSICIAPLTLILLLLLLLPTQKGEERRNQKLGASSYNNSGSSAAAASAAAAGRSAVDAVPVEGEWRGLQALLDLFSISSMEAGSLSKGLVATEVADAVLTKVAAYGPFYQYCVCV